VRDVLRVFFVVGSLVEGYPKRRYEERTLHTDFVKFVKFVVLW
jgi:hypothetical protein